MNHESAGSSHVTKKESALKRRMVYISGYRSNEQEIVKITSSSGNKEKVCPYPDNKKSSILKQIIQ